MQKRTAALILVITVIFSSIVYVSIRHTPYTIDYYVHICDVPTVPAVELSYPVVSNPGGSVNSSVQFISKVNTFIDGPVINSISYSVDGGEKLTLTNLTITTYHDYGPTKVDFKVYKATISLKDLPEGNHTVAAFSNDMTTSEFFVVNSYYHITALNVLSPKSQTYTSSNVPLNFTYTGDIINARYYLYRGKELVIDNPLSGNTTIDNIPNGNYRLLVYVTTQYGQDSTEIDFQVAHHST
jgi:hypothetical protein